MYSMSIGEGLNEMDLSEVKEKMRRRVDAVFDEEVLWSWNYTEYERLFKDEE